MKIRRKGQSMRTVLAIFFSSFLAMAGGIVYSQTRDGSIVHAAGAQTTPAPHPAPAGANAALQKSSGNSLHNHPGVPAIPARNVSAGPASPSFSQADALQYVAAHGAGAKVGSSAPLVIEKVDFLTGREIEAKLNHGIGEPLDTLYCFVTVHGTFTVSGPGGAFVRTSHTAYNLFDAHSGNRIATLVDTAK